MKKRGKPFEKGHKINVGRKYSLERNKKIAKALTGKKLSEITKEKIGRKSRGRTLNILSRQKISKANSGSKCHWWKGGISKNKEYISWLKNKRNRLKKIAIGSHTFGEWEILKAQYNWICPCCNKKKFLTEDHIVPLSRGGSDNIENIQPLCKSCNSKKHVKIVKYET